MDFSKEQLEFLRKSFLLFSEREKLVNWKQTIPSCNDYIDFISNGYKVGEVFAGQTFINTCRKCARPVQFLEYFESKMENGKRVLDIENPKWLGLCECGSIFVDNREKRGD